MIVTDSYSESENYRVAARVAKAKHACISNRLTGLYLVLESGGANNRVDFGLCGFLVSGAHNTRVTHSPQRLPLFHGTACCPPCLASVFCAEGLIEFGGRYLVGLLGDRGWEHLFCSWVMDRCWVTDGIRGVRWIADGSHVVTPHEGISRCHRHCD